MPKKRVRGENAGELLRNKLYKSVHKCIGNNFFRFPESEPKRIAWINAIRTKEWTPSESSRASLCCSLLVGYEANNCVSRIVIGERLKQP